MNLSSRGGCAPVGNWSGIYAEETDSLGGVRDSSGGTLLSRRSHARADTLAPAPDSFVAYSPITATVSTHVCESRQTYLTTVNGPWSNASRVWGIHTRGEPVVALTIAPQMVGM